MNIKHEGSRAIMDIVGNFVLLLLMLALIICGCSTLIMCIRFSC